jgi:GDP-D-mannose dehydratase
MPSIFNTVKHALVIGITGQHGCLISDLLLDKWCSVHGIKPRTSN